MSQKFSLVACDASNIDLLPCCGISNPGHPGRQAKCAWLRDNFELGARAKILTDSGGKPCGYIEYMPGERCWRGVETAGYMMIQCIWNQSKAHQRKGWASAMLADCLADAKSAGMKAVFAPLYNGRMVADHQESRSRFRNIMRAEGLTARS